MKEVRLRVACLLINRGKKAGMRPGGDGHIKRMGQQHDLQHPWPGRNSLCMGSGELPTTMWPATACSCLGRSKNGPESVRRSDVVSTVRGQSACRDHTDHQTRAPSIPKSSGAERGDSEGRLDVTEMRVVGLPESDCSENGRNDVTVSGLPAIRIDSAALRATAWVSIVKANPP